MYEQSTLDGVYISRDNQNGVREVTVFSAIKSSFKTDQDEDTATRLEETEKLMRLTQNN
jgi:hypothetical protein